MHIYAKKFAGINFMYIFAYINTKTKHVMSKVKFDTTKEEDSAILEIVSRARKEFFITDGLSLAMDLEATHANGTPLDFEKLLSFDESNFAHDIYGIMNHIDRKTGQLTRCFLPRCSK